MPAPLAVPDPPDSKSLATCLSQDLLISRAGGGVRSGVHTFCKLAFPSILFPAGSSARPITVCNTTTAYGISPRKRKLHNKTKPLESVLVSLLCPGVCLFCALPRSETKTTHFNLDGLAEHFCMQKIQPDSGVPQPSPFPCLLPPAFYSSLCWASLESDS